MQLKDLRLLQSNDTFSPEFLDREPPINVLSQTKYARHVLASASVTSPFLHHEIAEALIKMQNNQ